MTAIVGHCARCNCIIKNSEMIGTFIYKDLMNNTSRIQELCEKCTGLTHMFIKSYTDAFYRKKELCPRCNIDDEGYAQGECLNCGMLNK